jgi:hypothetical protein
MSAANAPPTAKTIIITIVKMRFMEIPPSGLSRPGLFSTSGHAFWMWILDEGV